MSAPTKLIPAQLVSDLSHTITRLKQCRRDHDIVGEFVAEERLNALIDRIPR